MFILFYLCLVGFLQLFDLHGELDWLAKHMDHDVDIHKLACRLHTSTVKINKAGKVLAALDQGQKSNFKAKERMKLLFQKVSLLYSLITLAC